MAEYLLVLGNLLSSEDLFKKLGLDPSKAKNEYVGLQNEIEKTKNLGTWIQFANKV